MGNFQKYKFSQITWLVILGVIIVGLLTVICINTWKKETVAAAFSDLTKNCVTYMDREHYSPK